MSIFWKAGLGTLDAYVVQDMAQGRNMMVLQD